MADRDSQLLGSIAGESDDGGDLLRREPRRRPAAVVIGEDLANLLLEERVILRFGLEALQKFLVRSETASPPSHPLGIDAERACLLDAQFALARAPHNLCSLDDALSLRS